MFIFVYDPIQVFEHDQMTNKFEKTTTTALIYLTIMAVAILVFITTAFRQFLLHADSMSFIPCLVNMVIIYLMMGRRAGH